MVDDPRDALECFGSAPVDLLAIGPFVVRRASALGDGGRVTAAVRDDVVVPTVGRPSLRRTAAGARPGGRPAAGAVVVVDDRRRRRRRAARRAAGWQDGDPGARPAARGPAAARNVGWRAASADWVASSTTMSCPAPAGSPTLAADLAGLGRAAPARHRRDGSWCRCRTAGGRPTGSARPPAWQDARWITADMAYRRDALAAVGGFDERFPRAFREDADLALRVRAAGGRCVRGRAARPASRSGRRAAG